MQNPFNTRYPIDPEFFADRNKERDEFKRDLKRTLDSRLPENIAILGDWGVGKSSLAYKLADMAAHSDGAKVLSTGIEIPRTIKSMDDFCFLLLFKLNQDIASSANVSNKIREELKKWTIQNLQVGPFTIERRSEDAPRMPFIQLQSKLIELWNDYLAKENVDLVVIVIDDVHHLLSSVKDGILDLRTVFQSLPRYKCNYQLIITGPKDLFGNVRELAEPVVRFFNTYKLESLDLDETRELIKFPLKKAGLDILVNEKVIENIYEKTKGHPYFISSFIQILLDECDGKAIDQPFYKSLLPKISQRLETQKFDKDLEMVSDSEKDLLFTMARNEKEEISLSDVTKSKRAVPKLLERLVEKGILAKPSRGKYKLYHPLFKEYLVNRALEMLAPKTLYGRQKKILDEENFVPMDAAGFPEKTKKKMKTRKSATHA
jgi:ABC-type dipeptide/oligopeptide/nickel transport system ATPase subunit